MSERWQGELSKLRRAELPQDLWDRIAEGPQLAPLPPRARSRVVAAVVAFAVFAAAGVLVWVTLSPLRMTRTTSLGGPVVLNVPPRGAASPEFLPDGRPIFVVHHEDGAVSVIDAFSSHRAFGFEELLVWCPSTRHFVEAAHEARFDEYGSYRLGGPAPSGIATFDFEVVERNTIGEPISIRVGEMRDPSPGGSAPDVGDSRPPFCPPGGDPAGPTVQVTSGNSGQVADVVAHAIDEASVWESPAEVVAAKPDGWVAVRGTLLVSHEDGFVQLCSSVMGEPGPPGSPDPRQCTQGAIVRGIDGIKLLLDVLVPHPGSYYEAPQVWLARVEDGVLDDLAGAVSVKA